MSNQQRLPEVELLGNSLVLVVTGECDPDVCSTFSTRGGGCMDLPPYMSVDAVREFTSRACPRCGVRPRLVTEPVRFSP